MAERPRSGFSRKKALAPGKDPKEIFSILPEDRAKQYDMYAIIDRLVDESKITEYKAGYGKSIICAYARIDGWSV